MFIIGTVASWGREFQTAFRAFPQMKTKITARLLVITWFGRRTLYISGLVMMDIVLLLIGIMAFFPSNGTKLASGSLLIVLNFAYNATLGPICYTLISEVGSTRLRAKTIVLSRIAYQVVSLAGSLHPRPKADPPIDCRPTSSAASSSHACCHRLHGTGAPSPASSGPDLASSAYFTASSDFPKPVDVRTVNSTCSSKTTSRHGVSARPRSINSISTSTPPRTTPCWTRTRWTRSSRSRMSSLTRCHDAHWRLQL